MQGNSNGSPASRHANYGNPPTTCQMSHTLPQHQNLQNDESPGFSFNPYNIDDSQNQMWIPNPTIQPHTPMNTDDVENIINEPFWPSRPTQAFTHHQLHPSLLGAAHPSPSHHQHPPSPDQVQQLHHLQPNLSPGHHSSPSSVHVEAQDELQVLQRHHQVQHQHQPHQQHQQHQQQHHQHQQQQQQSSISQSLSPEEQRHLQQMQFHHQISSHGASASPRQQHQQHPGSPQPPATNAIVQQNVFSLPQAIHVSRTSRPSPQFQAQVKHERLLVPLSQGLSNSSHLHLDSRLQSAGSSQGYSDERDQVDPERYVILASRMAEQAKLEHRLLLKESQKSKEVAADATGKPLTAKAKERERSRRESAVTRKRQEIYVNQLEETARRLPRLEQEITSLRREVVHLRQVVSAHQHQHVTHQPAVSAAVLTALPGSGVTKSEPGQGFSPNKSTNTTHVCSGLEELDL